MSGIARRARCGAAVAVVVSVLASVPVAVRAEPAAADIQWAQIFLKEKGFDIGGRANGQMTPQTRAALSGYQKSVGLPATGQLDSATTARIMGEREKKASPTMGSLSKSQIGQTPRDREVAPRAAPTARIDSGNESVGGMAQFGSAPVSSPSSGAPARTSSTPPASGAPAHSSPAAVASAVPSPLPPRAASQGPAPGAAHGAAHGAEGAAPQAAPRGAVTAATPSGESVPVVEPAAASAMSGWMTNGLRYGVMGLVAATLGGIGFAWWRSGRGAVPAGVPGDGAPRDGRVEPSFGTPRRREELTTGPRLTARR